MRLAELAKAAGVGRFIYMSSCSVYGVGTDAYVDETTPPSPQTAYAICKTFVERDVDDAGVRRLLADVLSQRDRLRRVTADALRHRAEQPLRPGVHDARDQDDERRYAVAAAGARPRHLPGDRRRACGARETIHNEIMNVGDTAQNYRVREIAEIVGKCSPAARWPSAPSAPTTAATGCRSRRSTSTCRASAAPGTRRRGARQLFELFKSINFTAEMFQHSGFTRLQAARVPAEDRTDRSGLLLDEDRFPRLTSRAAARSCLPGLTGTTFCPYTRREGRNQAMRFTETKLKGAYVIDLERREDSRGFFARSFCQNEFEAHGLKPVIAQANLAFNHSKGTLRGMHFQFPPAAETKLVRATRGAILDIIVDLRPGEPDVPRAHRRRARRGQSPRPLRSRALRARLPGCSSDKTETSYQVGEFYAPECESGLAARRSRLGPQRGRCRWRSISDKDTVVQAARRHRAPSSSAA